jgi:hypothetical protein
MTMYCQKVLWGVYRKLSYKHKLLGVILSSKHNSSDVDCLQCIHYFIFISEVILPYWSQYS